MASKPTVRWWRWRANPLRRRSDLVEAWLLLATGVVMALGGAVFGTLTYQALTDTSQRQRDTRQQVSAVLLEDARAGNNVSMYAVAGGDAAHAPVRWTTPGGSHRTGVTQVDEGLRAGGSVEIWTDAHGRLTSEPPGPVAVVAQSAMMAVLTAAAFGGLVLATCHGIRARLDRRRAEQWEREWTAFCARRRPRAP